MRVAVFGATGGTGRAVVEKALARGHQVRAFARHPEALNGLTTRVEVTPGDAHDPFAVRDCVAGCDAVVSALGADDGHSATDVYSAGVKNILDAMRWFEVTRLLCVSDRHLPHPEDAAAAPWAATKLMPHPLRHKPYADMALMEHMTWGSHLDWTLVRAARLTDTAQAERYRTSLNCRLAHAKRISRGDLADYLVGHLSDPMTYHAIVEIAY
jgi:putative NADH-flavin reductase